MVYRKKPYRQSGAPGEEARCVNTGSFTAKVQTANAVISERLAEVWGLLGSHGMADKALSEAAEGRTAAGRLLAASADPMAARAYLDAEHAALPSKIAAIRREAGVPQEGQVAFEAVDDVTVCRRRAVMLLSAARCRNTAAGMCEIDGQRDKADEQRSKSYDSQIEAEDWLTAANDPVTAAEARADYDAERLAEKINAAVEGPCETLPVEEVARRL
jgi:hypothetical protein